MNHHIKLLALTVILSAFMVSCNKNESPVITIHELGYENTKTVVAGSDLHIDAEILASQKIASIQIIIHSEAEHTSAPAQKVSSKISVTEWAVDSIYTRAYAGVKNADFHEHLEVPSTAELGHYHFHIKVTDMDGNQTIKEDEIEILAPTL